MKRFLLLPLLTLLLASCGSQPEVPPAAAHPNLGTYWCTSAILGDMDLGTQGQWLRLEEEGRATLFLISEPDEGHWALNGSSFTLTMGGEKVAAGTLKNGVLTTKLMGMDCVFVLEGVTPPEAPSPAQPQAPAPTQEEPASPAAGSALFTCYGDLYQVTYPTALFRPSSDGLTDLTSSDGTKAWITRLDSQEATDTWLASFQAQAHQESPQGQTQALLPLTVAGFAAQAMVYETQEGWRSEVIVPFGRDLGSPAYPMYAACLTFAGPDREAVWSQEIQAIVHSLTLL